MYSRLDKLRQFLAETELDAVVLNPGPTLTYLTGLDFHISERPTVLLFSPNTENPVLVLPGLEMGKVQDRDISIHPFPYEDNPNSWGDSFKKAVSHLGLGKSLIGVEPNHLRFLEHQYLQQALPESRFISAAHILSKLRINKSPEEIQNMKQAVHIAETALMATLKTIQPGMDEREIASELTIQLLRAGSDPTLPFHPIVASGPNSANPHAIPGSRKIQAGDFLLFDFGASYNGYYSDITRTLAVGEVDQELKKIYQVVKEANSAARQAVKPGTPAGEVDSAARKVIQQAGYGDYFIHRTGHGLGLEIHEPPYIFTDNPVILEKGMTFTVEPGIYLFNRAGVRIEDNVVVTADGCETITGFSRELMILE